ncbi:MAG: peptidylprolyl isomerase [Patescibacteria group bacterium]
MNNKTSFLIFGVLVVIIVVLFTSGILKNPFSENKEGEVAEEEIQKSVNLQNKENNMEQKTNEVGIPAMEINVEKKYTAVLHTDLGDISVLLHTKETPITANNFVYLAKKGLYNGTIFHRVIKGFMIQGGDPLGTGMGGPGYKFNDEPFQGEYTRGTVAMANAGPNTNGSQFFIMHADVPLPKNYVIFGSVVSGLDVVDKIANAEVVSNSGGEPSKPKTPVVVKSVDITEE